MNLNFLTVPMSCGNVSGRRTRFFACKPTLGTPGCGHGTDWEKKELFRQRAGNSETSRRSAVLDGSHRCFKVNGVQGEPRDWAFNKW